MGKFYTFFVLVASTFLLVSFSINPPDGKTGAPGDGFCSECHNSPNPSVNGTITVEGFPENITPRETYRLTVINRDTIGNAVKGGFQLTILGQFNTKSGNMTNASANAAIANFQGRQYFEHRPSVVYPDSNVVRWSVDWTAPDATTSSVITWYVSGNISNGDIHEVGDRIVGATGKGTIILSATTDLQERKPILYPNPGNDIIHIEFEDDSAPDGQVLFYNLLGALVGDARMNQGSLHCPDLVPGIYIIEIKNDGHSSLAKWSKQ